MQLTSSAFRNDQMIPRRFTGEGADRSPPLQWTNVPEKTASFALICEDPDAPVRPGQEHPFLHWMIYDIPLNIRNLPEGIPTDEILHGALSAVQAKNSFGKVGYSGPLPPIGHGVHHYHFTLYALDHEMEELPNCTKADLLAEMKGHVLTTATIIGTYERTMGRERAGDGPREGVQERSLSEDALVFSSESDEEEKRRERSIFSS